MHVVHVDGGDLPVLQQLPDPSVDDLLVLVGVCVDVAPPLAYGLERPGPHQKLGDVLLGGNARRLLGIIRYDLVLGELELADRISQRPVQDLAVELPEQRRTVLHQDYVGESGEDGGMRERGRGPGVADQPEPHLLGIQQIEDVLGVLDVHVVLHDLPVGLLDDRDALHVAQHLQQIGGPHLLPVDGDGPTHVVPEDHEAARGGVPEPELEDLRVLQGLPEDLLQLGRSDEAGDQGHVEPSGTSQHEAVVRDGDRDVRADHRGHPVSVSA